MPKKWVQKTLDDYEGFFEIVRIEMENQKKVRELYSLRRKISSQDKERCLIQK